jgi:peptidoglycan hydrolase CwlO-like protein
MSLTTNDLNEIKNIVESALSKQSSEVIRPIQDEVEALRNDIGEIYDMIANLQKTSKTKQAFQKLSLEDKILDLHTDLVEAAKQAGVRLPSH